MITELKNLKYSEILKRNKELLASQTENPYNIAVVSNIITSHLNDILEFQLRNHQINAKVRSGDYDNIIQDCQKFQSQNVVIIFWELANIIDGFQAGYDLLTEQEQHELFKKLQIEINFVFEQLKNTSLVLMNTFSALVFSQYALRPSPFERLAVALNQYLEKNRPDNFFLIDIDKILARVSIQACVDFRYFYSSKALYSVEFYKEYTTAIQPIILSAAGKIKKALIFDCDNTLWKGVLGEDGIDGIEMSPHTPDGSIFREIQDLSVGLSRQGVILGICSKNNPQDVEEVLKNCVDFQLKEDMITLKKVNWDDKVKNLRDMARELNIGLDSLVFVDDSEFEIQFINDQLPEVTTILVPKKLYLYPETIRRHINLFFKADLSEEDSKRIRMYQDEMLRKDEEKKYDSIEDYLKSLELKMIVYTNDTQHLDRLVQLTQKTNQFNLTTIRYTQADLSRMISDGNHQVYSFQAEDKFGQYGLVGMAIIRLDLAGRSADINTLLMSCRIIGRNIEFQFVNFIFNELKNHNIETVTARYIKTKKNSQVSDLYDKIGFSVSQSNDTCKEYIIRTKDYLPNHTNYIEVLYG
jgi:FkbH-like protein